MIEGGAVVVLVRMGYGPNETGITNSACTPGLNLFPETVHVCTNSKNDYSTSLTFFEPAELAVFTVLFALKAKNEVKYTLLCVPTRWTMAFLGDQNQAPT